MVLYATLKGFLLSKMWIVKMVILLSDAGETKIKVVYKNSSLRPFQRIATMIALILNNYADMRDMLLTVSFTSCTNISSSSSSIKLFIFL